MFYVEPGELFTGLGKFLLCSGISVSTFVPIIANTFINEKDVLICDYVHNEEHTL
jgi:hypothetical protein